jgi:predicted ATP-dependent Lon-type protease
MFVKIPLWFFVTIGHTHEVSDGDLGYLSKKVKEHDNYVLANLMKMFMTSQDHPSILQLIQKILNF